jgi:uncharacterized membrane protein YkoI
MEMHTGQRLASAAVVAASIAAFAGCSHHHKDSAMAGSASNQPAPGSEVPVKMADLPAAVRATLEKEAAGGKVMEVEKEMQNGKTVYSADVMVKGQTWDITVDESGKVIKKEMEKANAYEKDKNVK